MMPHAKSIKIGWFSIFFVIFLVLFLYSIPVFAISSSTVFVNPDASGSLLDGSSWDEGLPSINAGLTTAESQGSSEVWVKAGTYNESVQLKTGISLLGGFDGTENDSNDRNWPLNQTVIDAGSPMSYYHAVFGVMGATIDGFIITGGNANGTGDDAVGGGIFNKFQSPTIQNCLIKNNYANSGGAGIYNEGAIPMIQNTIVANNFTSLSGSNGAGIFNLNSNPSLYNVTVTGNGNYDETTGSGAMANSGTSAPMVYNSILWGNTPAIGVDNPGSGTYEFSVLENQTVGTTNLDSDPNFEVEDPFYRLSHGSPCIDSGYTESFLPFQDIDKQEMFDYFGAPNTGAGSYGDFRDIGADEFVPGFLSPGTYYVDAQQGTDDPDHGIGPGTDAWKSLHYSLQLINNGSVGSYTLMVAAGTYSVPNENDSGLEIFDNTISVIGVPQNGLMPVLDGTENTAWETALTIKRSDALVKGLEFKNFSQGIFVDNCSPEISGNYFHDLAGDAIEVYSYNSEASPKIFNNLIVFEPAVSFAAAISEAKAIRLTPDESATPSVNPQIFHNTLIGCVSCTGDSKGIYVTNSMGAYAAPEIKYNIIRGFPAYGMYNASAQNTVISDYNVIYNNGSGNYVGITAGTNDQITDPVLMSDGSYRLDSNSPCIDAIPGNEDDPVSNDFFGTTRPMGSGKDIGCHEFASSIGPGEYFVDISRPDDTGDGTSVGTAWKYLHTAINYINMGSPGNYTLHVLDGIYSTTTGEPDSALTLTQDNVRIIGEDGAVIDSGNASNWEAGLEIAAQGVGVENLTFSNFVHCGILVEDRGPEIERNIFQNNGYCAIDILGTNADASPIIENNLITLDNADSNGIVVTASMGTTYPAILHNTIDGSSGMGTGHGILVRQLNAFSAEPDILFNIITNHGDYGIFNDGGSPNVDFNNVWNNNNQLTNHNYGNVSPGTNDISEDPLFGSWTLRYGSPCMNAIPLDAGDTSNEDIDENMRPLGSGFDMGCYEHEAISPGTYFVDNLQGQDIFGKGNGPGTDAFKTLHFALTLINGGEPGGQSDDYILYVTPGTPYNFTNGETDTQLEITQDGVTVDGSGVPLVVVKSSVSDGSRAVLDGSGAASWFSGFRITGHQVSLRNFQIQNFPNCGIVVEDSNPIIEKNVLLDNLFCGILISSSLSGADPLIQNNYIRSNIAGALGIYLEAQVDARPMILHNTIVGGQNNNAGAADGIFIENQGAGMVEPAIEFNIIAGFPGFGVNNDGGSPTLFLNDIWNNTAGQFDGYTPSEFDGNIDINPQFLDEFELRGTSPCIDAIAPPENPPPHPVNEDIDGVFRPQGDNYDMGCFEYEYTQINPATYFVDIVNGTDDPTKGTGAGTGAWKTFHYAITMINRGTPDITRATDNYLLKVAAGTYSVGNGEPEAGLTVFRDNLTIEGSTVGESIIDGTGSTNWHWGIEVEASNVTIKNLSFTGFNDSMPNGGIMTPGPFRAPVDPLSTDGEAAIVIQEGTGNKIESCKVYGNHDGIVMNSRSSGTTVGPDCRIYHNMVAGVLIDGSSGNHVVGNTSSIYDNGGLDTNNDPSPGAGVEIENNADNNHIHENNIFWTGDTTHPQAVGILITNSGMGNEIYQNLIHDNFVSGSLPSGGIIVVDSSPKIYRNEIVDAGDSGIYVKSETVQASPKIINNLIYNTTNTDLFRVQGSINHGIWVDAMDFAANPDILHNTIKNSGNNGITITASAANLAVPNILYNIIANSPGCGISHDPAFSAIPLGDWNDLWQNGGGDFCNAVPGPNNLFLDPKFDNLKLQPGSPCRDAIPTTEPDPVTEDFDGNSRPRNDGYDIGAYEMAPPEDKTLTVQVVDPGTGVVSLGGGTCSNTCSRSIPEGTSLVLSINSAASGYTFFRWEDENGNVLGTNSALTVTMDADKTVRALFQRIQYTLSVNVTPSGGGSVSGGNINCPNNCSQTFDSGASGTLTATAAAGFRFVQWVDSNGNQVGTNSNTLTITMDSNKAIQAVFEPLMSTLNVEISPAGAGSVQATGIACPGDCTQTFNTGTEVSLRATANERFTFDRWLGVPLPTSNPTRLTMDSNKRVVAVFVETASANQPPVLQPIGNKTVTEGENLSFMLNAADPDQDPLTFIAQGLPAGATFNGLAGPTVNVSANGTSTSGASGNTTASVRASAVFSWTPAHEQIGAHQVSFIVNDGELNDRETITITVLEAVPENAPPVLQPIGDKTVNEGALLSFAVSATDSDAGDTLTFSATNLPPGALFNGNHTFSWNPGFDQAGTYQVTFSVTDGKAVDTEQITITVNNVNTPPELDPIGTFTGIEGELISFQVNASDREGDTLTFSAMNLPQGASFNAATQIFSWTPATGQRGTYQVAFSVTDGQFSDDQTVAIEVGTNLPVVPSPFPYDQISPERGATRVDPEGLCFKWPSADNAQFYHLMVAKNGDFQNPVVNKQNIGQTEFCVPNSGNRFSKATVYKWKVYAANANGQVVYPTFGFFTKEDQINVIVTPPEPLTPFQSRMISFPLIPGRTNPYALLAPILGSRYGIDWRLHRIDSAGVMREYPNVPDVSPGISYWLSSRGTQSLNVSGQTVSLTQDYVLTIPPGFFQLGCPFPFPVNWGDVKVRAGNTTVPTGDLANRWIGPLWDGDYKSVKQLVPWNGYYTINYSGRSVDLLIPPSVAGN